DGLLRERAHRHDVYDVLARLVAAVAAPVDEAVPAGEDVLAQHPEDLFVRDGRHLVLGQSTLAAARHELGTLGEILLEARLTPQPLEQRVLAQRARDGADQDPLAVLVVALEVAP